MRNFYLLVFSLLTLAGIRPGWTLAQIPVTEHTEIDSSQKDTVEVDSTVYYEVDPTRFFTGTDTLNVQQASRMPLLSLQQVVKGKLPGIFVQEPSGEPGTVEQTMMIRGMSRPILNRVDIYQTRPVVYLNGIPLIQDNPFVYNVQQSDLVPIGPATNLLSILDMDNIQSVHVLKDFEQLGLYGPRAANGAVFITTENAHPGARKLSINSYFGFAQAPGVRTVNAAYEKNFRLPFYYRYGSQQDLEQMPAYLSDSTNLSYYGPSNWSDLYYRNTPTYSVNGSLMGGSERSNFRFFGGHTRSVGTADDTRLNRYTGAFYINMLPAEWLTVSSMVHANWMDRKRNKNLRDRFAEMRFLPGLSNPLPANKEIYGAYLREYDKSIDENLSNSIQGYLTLNAHVGELNYSPRLMFDYNEGRRDVFWPSTLFNGSNYVSNYYGYNQRLLFDNVVDYTYALDAFQDLKFAGGFSYSEDTHRYNYGYGYDGPNDFIKINVVEGDPDKGGYMTPTGFITYNFTDKVRQRLLSFYGQFTYSLKDKLDASVFLRRDGYSAMQPAQRWFTSPGLSLNYHVGEKLGMDRLDLRASWGRMGNLRLDERVGAGPQYTSQLGWSDFPTMTSYNGFGTYSRPYNSGWVGYDLPWAYTEVLNAGAEMALLNHALSLKIDVYQKDNKEMTLAVPTVAGSGYRSELLSGMWVRNQGVELNVSAMSTPTSEGIQWNGQLNIAYNNNELMALPQGADEMTVGNRKLRVGHRIDAFWLLENRGLFQRDMDVPVNPDNFELLNYEGVAMKGGDPRWVDQNSDYVIDDRDRVFMGNTFPKWIGGFTNQIAYKGFDLSVFMYFNLGKYALNQQAATFFDFINTDNAHALPSVKEITNWQERADTDAYPLYNPWSEVRPYQVEQDMFLENASFLKLRSATLGYTFDPSGFLKNKARSLYVYVTGTNLFTLTPYGGGDPELVNYMGYDTGYGLPIPRTFVFGIKLDI